jgi:hypothetical protein
VAWGIVRFGPEHRTDFKDALEHADHDLFVELGALRQIGRAAEVVEREHVGAALGRCAHDLRGLNLDKVHRLEGSAKSGQRGRRHAKGRPRLRMAQCHRRVIEDGRLLGVEFRMVQIKGGRNPGGGEHRHRGPAHLHTARGLRVRHRRPVDGEDRFAGKFIQRGDERGILDHDLGGASTVSDDQKGETAEAAQLVQPPG